MNRKYLSTTIFGAALLLFAACTNDELTDGTDALPEGKYPLQIASVTMEGESSVQPWGAGAPQTRVSENEDGMSSKFDWNDTEQIGVQIENSTKSGIYKLTSEKKVESVTPVYWEDTQSHKVRAWYPADGNVDLNNQTTENGLAYALFAETESAVDYSTSNITLPFAHKLAKVRVVLQGNGINNVEEVKIKTFTSCTLKADGTLTNDGTEEYIPMVKTTLEDNTVCWEANVVSGHAITAFKVNGNDGKLNNENGITPEVAKVNTITLNVSIAGLEIKDNTYIVSSATALRAWGEAAQSDPTLNCTLAADIALTGTDNWTPVGSYSNRYAGTFDGAGHTISNVNCSGTDAALFSYIGSTGKVKNLTLKEPEISVTKWGAGIAVVCNGTIENCHVRGGNITAKVSAGGIVAEITDGTVIACTNSANILNNSDQINPQTAGIVSFMCGGSVIACSNFGEISGKDGYTGGIIAYMTTITQHNNIVSLFNKSKVTGGSNNTGAICGYQSGGFSNSGCYWQKVDGIPNAAIGTGTLSLAATEVDGDAITWASAVTGLNAAIDTYNASAADDKKCNYKWAVNTGADKETVPLVLEKSN